MLPVLRRAAQGETRVAEAEEKIAAEFALTREERDLMLASGRQKILHNRIHWAKFYLSKAGLIVSPRRGWFTASEAGRALLARDPGRIDVKLLSEYPGFKDFYRGGPGDKTAAGAEEALGAAPGPIAMATPEEQIEQVHLAAQIALEAPPVGPGISAELGYFAKNLPSETSAPKITSV